MRIIPTKTVGKWEIEGVGTIVRTAQGAYFVTVPKDTELAEDQLNQISKFIEDSKNSK